MAEGSHKAAVGRTFNGGTNWKEWAHKLTVGYDRSREEWDMSGMWYCTCHTPESGRSLEYRRENEAKNECFGGQNGGRGERLFEVRSSGFVEEERTNSAELKEGWPTLFSPSTHRTNVCCERPMTCLRRKEREERKLSAELESASEREGREYLPVLPIEDVCFFRWLEGVGPIFRKGLAIKSEWKVNLGS